MSISHKGKIPWNKAIQSLSGYLCECGWAEKGEHLYHCASQTNTDYTKTECMYNQLIVGL